MSRKNGYVLVDISDGRVMTVGLDTATVEGVEIPGIKVIKNGASRNFLLPMNKEAGNHTIATLDDISGGGGKLYKHDIYITMGVNVVRGFFYSSSATPTTKAEFFTANVEPKNFFPQGCLFVDFEAEERISVTGGVLYFTDRTDISATAKEFTFSLGCNLVFDISTGEPFKTARTIYNYDFDSSDIETAGFTDTVTEL